jgi:hypothetical protein
MLLDQLEDLQQCFVGYILVRVRDLFADDLLLRRAVLGDVLVQEEPLQLDPDSLAMGDANEVGVHAVSNALKRS